MKIQNISKLALYLGMGIAVLVLVLFFCIGFDTPSEEVADKNEPQLTDLLIWSMYFYVFILAAFTIGNLALAVTKFRDSGLIRVITYCGGSLVLYFIFRMICSGQEAPEGVKYTGADMAVADAYIWTIGILFVVAAAVSVLCASGFMAKSATKK